MVKGLIVGAAALILLCGGCYRASEATVNGEPIHREDFQAALKLAQGHKILQKLILQRLITQEARNLDIVVDDSEIQAHIEDIAKHTNDEDMIRVLVDEVRSRILLRKMLLRDVTEDRLRQLYGFFKEDLAQYELYVLATKSKEEAELVRAGLQRGEAFRLLASSYGKYKTDRESGGLRGSFNRAQLASSWGADVADVIVALKPANESIIAEFGGDYLVLSLGRVVSTFEELKPMLEDLEANASRPEFLFRLFAKAQVTSPYLTDPKRLPVTRLYEEVPLPWDKGAGVERLSSSTLGPADPKLPGSGDPPTVTNVTSAPKDDDLQID